MICKFEKYKSVYCNSKKEYVSFHINLKKLKEQQTRLRINALLRDEDCFCDVCKSYTGN